MNPKVLGKENCPEALGGGAGERNISEGGFGGEDQGPQSLMSLSHRNSRPRKWETSREPEKQAALEPLEMVRMTPHIIDEEMRCRWGGDGLKIKLGIFRAGCYCQLSPALLSSRQAEKVSGPEGEVF